MKTKFDVKGEEYKFDIVDPDTEKDSNWDGLCRKFEKQIYLSKYSPGIQHSIITVIHEWGHALLHECSIDDTLVPEVEEMIVDNYAKELYKVFFSGNAFADLLKKMVAESDKLTKKDKKKKGKGKK